MKRNMWGPPPPIPALMAPSAMTVGPEGVVEPIAPPQSRPRPSTAPNFAGSAA